MTILAGALLPLASPGYLLLARNPMCLSTKSHLPSPLACLGSGLPYSYHSLNFAHGPNALHVLSIADSVRSFVLYGTTFFANGLILRAGVGPGPSLLVLGACQAACWLTSIPMYVYGKRVRSFIARHPRLFRGDLPASSFDNSTEHSDGKSVPR
ncbi:hypothetical protein GSI_05770 [Ganoderma sinense ZZ0214-1]|uniref:Uncharacterized protein n=1 Tax=Ganoderma sinense ZZ0214-1 TaxID=1077348 RepID=A0A2G8SBD1_9APHY|nr:hypothetical protein GSI_05770 [Ganoderma sinense ZZ0214-1]